MCVGTPCLPLSISPHTVPPTITSSFLVDPNPCLDYPLIIREMDTDPVILTVNITADPCPTAEWTLNGTIVTTDTPGITVSYTYTPHVSCDI